MLLAPFLQLQAVPLDSLPGKQNKKEHVELVGEVHNCDQIYKFSNFSRLLAAQSRILVFSLYVSWHPEDLYRLL